MKETKIKNLKLIKRNIEDTLSDPFGLAALGMAGVMVVTLAVGIPAVIEEQKYLSNYTTVEETMSVGQHIIKVPYQKNSVEVQYEGHEGYKVVAMNDRYLIYENFEEVVCTGKMYEDGKCVFQEFGTPVELEETTETSYTK